jgi:hypothetical protein
MRCVFVTAGAMIAVSLASAAPTESAVLLLAAMPVVPTDAPAAYAQWKDVQGSIEYGPVILALRKELQDAADASNTPPPEKGPEVQPTQADIALANTIGPYADSDLPRKVNALMSQAGALNQAWLADETKLNAARVAAFQAVKPCPEDKAGNLRPVASLQAVADHYSDLRLALAQTYLAKFAGLQAQLLGLIQPEAAHVDKIIADWNKLPNSFMKASLYNAIRNNYAVAVSHVSEVLALETTGSRRAAQAVADRRAVDAKLKVQTPCTWIP